MFLAAVIQMGSTDDEGSNLDQAEGLIRRAATSGARWIGTPENTNYLGPPAGAVAGAQPLDGPTPSRFASLARELKVHLLLGSYNERGDDAMRYRNVSVLFGPDGERLAVYRKIHLFDVDLPDGAGGTHRESDSVAPGAEAVVAETELGRFGLSICYDLRFGNLYRRLRRAGAEILTIPAAFTMATGRDHWEVLLRARAIESQCYVFAPAQWGRHDASGKRESYGHAMIVDPWGTVVARAADGPGLALAEIDLERVRRARRAIPVAGHSQEWLDSSLDE
jgi:predicted amidohydrolase